MPDPESRLTLDRQALFDRVWETPMLRLSKEIGISDVGLAKVCRRMKIPVPGRGHWAKVASGRQIRRPALKPLLPNDTITQRELIVDRAAKAATTIAADGPLAEQVAFEADARNRIVVKARQRSYHALVKASAAALQAKGAKAGEYIPTWQLRTLDIDVTKALLPRALRVMDALVVAFEARGWRVRLGDADDRRSFVRVFDQEVAFGIREPIRKVRNEPATPVRLGPGRVYTPYQTEFRDEPAGRLALIIRNSWGGYGVHRSFDERAGPPVEERLNGFALAVATEGYHLAEAARKRLENERERLEAQDRFRAEERERVAKQARVNQLLQDAASWRVAMDLRAYQAAVVARAEETLLLGEADPAVVAWLEWLGLVIAEQDPLSRPTPVWAKAARSELA